MEQDCTQLSTWPVLFHLLIALQCGCRYHQRCSTDEDPDTQWTRGRQLCSHQQWVKLRVQNPALHHYPASVDPIGKDECLQSRFVPGFQVWLCMDFSSNPRWDMWTFWVLFLPVYNNGSQPGGDCGPQGGQSAMSEDISLVVPPSGRDQHLVSNDPGRYSTS